MQEQGGIAGQSAIDPYARYRFVGAAFALLALAASVLELWRNFAQPSDRDFLAVWSAGKLALAGRPWAAYDNSLLHAIEAAAATFSSAGAQLPFPYPPAYLALTSPFALLSFPAAMALWAIATFAFYLFASRRLMPGSGWLVAAFPAVFANAAIGQNGFLTAGLFMLGLSLLASAPFAAGLVLGCLVIKPQLGLLIPVALVAGRYWRAVGGATVSAFGIILLGLLAFGGATTVAWLQEAPLIVKVTGDGLMGWSKLASVYAAARQAGFDAGSAIAIHAVIAAVIVALTWRVWRSDAEQGAKWSLLAAGSMLMSPYVFYYDGLILVPAYFYLARREVPAPVLLALWIVPLVVLANAADRGNGVNLNPVVPLAIVAILCRIEMTSKALADRANLTIRQPFGVRIFQRVWR